MILRINNRHATLTGGGGDAVLTWCSALDATGGTNSVY